jgi:predicted AlkP superfamily phosphohydrolase/phosphomutase
MFSMKLSGKEEPLIDSTLRMTEKRIKLATYLMREKPWEFCYVVFVGADRLQHPLWDEIMALDSRVIEYYHLLDYGLGLILEQLGPDDRLFVVSDHGFQGARRFFDINEYLYSKGLLSLANSEQRNRASHFTDLKHTLDRFKLLSLARKVKKALKKSGVFTEEAVDVYRPVLTDVDWQQTTAYVPSVSGFGGGYADIFLTDDLDAERVVELCADLKKQVDPVTEQPLVDALYTTEVFGTGPYAPPEQHLLILPSDGITFRMSFGNKHLWDSASKTRGTHQKDGVLYAYGGGIKRGFKAPNAEVYDLVPTLLRSMNLPFPCTFDGRALDELFEERKQVEQPIAAAVNDAESSLIRSKLKKLLEA